MQGENKILYITLKTDSVFMTQTSLGGGGGGDSYIIFHCMKDITKASKFRSKICKFQI